MLMEFSTNHKSESVFGPNLKIGKSEPSNGRVIVSRILFRSLTPLPPVIHQHKRMTVTTKPHLIMLLHSNSNRSDNEDENKNVVIQLQKIDPIIKN